MHLIGPQLALSWAQAGPLVGRQSGKGGAVSRAAPSDPRPSGTEKAKTRPPEWAAYTRVTTGCFLPASGSPPSTQLLGFCLLGTLETVVGLHEEKPSTLPVANRTCFL